MQKLFVCNVCVARRIITNKWVQGKMKLQYNQLNIEDRQQKCSLMISHRIWRHMFIHEIKIPIQSPFPIWNKQKRIMKGVGKFNKQNKTGKDQSIASTVIVTVIVVSVIVTRCKGCIYNACPSLEMWYESEACLKVFNIPLKYYCLSKLEFNSVFISNECKFKCKFKSKPWWKSIPHKDFSSLIKFY